MTRFRRLAVITVATAALGMGAAPAASAQSLAAEPVGSIGLLSQTLGWAVCVAGGISNATLHDCVTPPLLGSLTHVSGGSAA